MTNETSQANNAKVFEKLPTISQQSYLFLQKWIHRESGILIDQHKTYLLQVRLAPIVEREKLGSMDNLCNTLRDGRPGIAHQVIEAMTTNETLFFRDKSPFDALRKHIVPKLIEARAKGEKLKFWSAACSTGQEAYSLAMVLTEMGLNSFDVDIFGSDLSDDALAKARLGIYNRFEINRGVSEEFQLRYFEESREGWRVKEPLRKMVRFQQMDLRNTLRGYGPFHVILCRNVLIYFDSESKAHILQEISHTLIRGGYLILGAAETVGSATNSLERTLVGNSIAYIAH